MRSPSLSSFVIAAGLAAAACLLSASASAAAAEQPLYATLSVEDAKSILKEWGATEIVDGVPEEMKVTDTLLLAIKVLNFKYSGLDFQARLYCHSAVGCAGLQVACAFEDSPATPLSTVNNYNVRYRAGKAYEEPGAMISERYIILDNGVTRANIVAQLQVYVAYTGYMVDFVKQSGIIAAASPTPSPFAKVMAERASVHAAAMNAKPKQLPLNRAR